MDWCALRRPLRGGKGSNFQGGIRVNAFVSGGFIPEAARGRKLGGLVALWDWYVAELYFLRLHFAFAMVVVGVVVIAFAMAVVVVAFAMRLSRLSRLLRLLRLLAWPMDHQRLFPPTRDSGDVPC